MLWRRQCTEQLYVLNLGKLPFLQNLQLSLRLIFRLNVHVSVCCSLSVFMHQLITDPNRGWAFPPILITDLLAGVGWEGVKCQEPWSNYSHTDFIHRCRHDLCLSGEMENIMEPSSVHGIESQSPTQRCVRMPSHNVHIWRWGELGASCVCVMKGRRGKNRSWPSAWSGTEFEMTSPTRR